MQINVTEAIISAGLPSDNRHCPIALAINRVLDQDYRAHIGRIICIQAWNRKVVFAIPIPDIALRFIDAFDNGEYVSPFTFDLDIPEFLTGASYDC
ncbi:MAG: hypothetical protein L0220_32915 [Acidobacteria bacterium]|nr:hypothetical protein [Acidobacteriota bacterium]